MKENLVWACECGDTIKFSGLPGSPTERRVEDLIEAHAQMGHEVISCHEAAQIRYQTAKRLQRTT